ncbi:MAG TPA: hypothetical protein VFW80_00890 [Gaiellaceae bacterium]|nr:hypothetical protein [Gaiellaceae bacterium]
MATCANDRTLILHIGLHKTATSYLQNILSARRHDLLREGVLYPTTGEAAGTVTFTTREGAQSGHALLTRTRADRNLVSELVDEIPDTAPTVLVSSEDFTLPRTSAEEHLSRFGAFGRVQVVLVLRRQDAWIESYYKQNVDQYGRFETRSFDEFLAQMGPKLLDFHTRFSPWRDLVGPESFHVLSFDDLPGGTAICSRLLEIAGVRGSLVDNPESIPVPRYESVRAIDTLGLRILNAYRLDNRDVRNRTARSIYAAAPDGDLELMTREMREGIQALCAPINERIEAEWFKEPVPGFRFGTAPGNSATSPPTGPEVVDYVDRVISLCEEARKSAQESGSAE